MTTSLEVPAQCPHCGGTALLWDLESFLPNFADPGFGTRIEAFLECPGCSREVLRVPQSVFLDFVNDERVG